MNITEQIKGFEKHLNLLNRSSETISNYSPSLERFLKYFNRDPKTITKNEAIDYLLTLPVFSRRTAIAAIKFFYKNCLNSDKFAKLEYPTTPEYTPEILSKEEINALIQAATNVKHRTAIILLYSTAMRVNECINLKWNCIDRATMRIHIKRGKGKKDRIVPLSETLLKQLIVYCNTYRAKLKESGCFQSDSYVFAGAKKDKYTRRSIETFLKKYAELAGIKKKVTPHILRHCQACHLRDFGVDIANIKDLLGHKHISTTEIYSRLSNMKLIPDLLA